MKKRRDLCRGPELADVGVDSKAMSLFCASMYNVGPPRNTLKKVTARGNDPTPRLKKPTELYF